MKRISIEELKKIQLNILNIVDSFCKNNDINYWIDSGTLLGAIRHKGYIPWDDDIDIGMLRKDYDKFMNCFNKKNSRYKFYSIENKNDFYYAHGKVLDTNTILYEPDEDTGLKLSVNIDVFVYDNAPDDDKIVKKMYWKRTFYQKMRNVQLFRHAFRKENLLKKVLRFILNRCFKLIPKSYFLKRIIENSKKFSKFETKRVGNFTATSVFVCDKSVFNSFIYKEFEEKQYPVPVGYDIWLKSMYGDYMQLPPEEKRISQHKFVAYYK